MTLSTAGINIAKHVYRRLIITIQFYMVPAQGIRKGIQTRGDRKHFFNANVGKLKRFGEFAQHRRGGTRRISKHRPPPRL